MPKSDPSSAYIKLFATPPHGCSYLPDETETTAFVDPDFAMSMDVYAHLIDQGFRRSGAHVYRPHCQTCSACIATRVVLAEFRMSKNQKRIWRRNQDLQIGFAQDFTDEHYALFERYVKQRHAGGGMDEPTPEGAKTFFLAKWSTTRLVEFRYQQTLFAVAIMDELDLGISAVYSFFEPAQHQRSLGTYAILWQLDYARQHGKAYAYLGYWVEHCQKMTYKIRFQPLQGFVQGQWQALVTHHAITTDKTE